MPPVEHVLVVDEVVILELHLLDEAQRPPVVLREAKLVNVELKNVGCTSWLKGLRVAVEGGGQHVLVRRKVLGRNFQRD